MIDSIRLAWEMLWPIAAPLLFWAAIFDLTVGIAYLTWYSINKKRGKQ